MKLQIGIVAESPVWKDVLLQEGVPFAQIDLANDSLAGDCSMLVVNRTLSALEREAVESYLRKGGAVLGYAQHLFQVAATNAMRERLEYIVSGSDAVFPSVHILDLGIFGAVPREANTLRTQADRFAVMAGPLGGGYAVVLPFDVESVLSDVRNASKCFYSTRDRLPAERVSLVSKGEVRQLLHQSFEYLHHARGLPYAHLWYFPYGKRNLFAFRVDTDGAPQRDVNELYHVAHAHGISMSWFLDVKSHEPWLKHFTGMVNQEIGAHCYEHRSFPAYGDSLSDIAQAVKAIEAVGLHPRGFSAPYGTWNEEIGKAIDHAGFGYSSEFGYAYDTLPLFPHTATTDYTTLQVPIHPICIGSMMKVGYSSAQMKEYYHRIIAEKLSRSEPLFFYHHPSHRHSDVVEFIVESVQQQGIDNISMGEYAQWWKKRLEQKLSLTIDGDPARMGFDSAATGNNEGSMTLRISNNRGEEAIVTLGKAVDLETAQWKPVNPPMPAPQDIRRIREFDPRTLLSELHNKLMRSFR